MRSLIREQSYQNSLRLSSISLRENTDFNYLSAEFLKHPFIGSKGIIVPPLPKDLKTKDSTCNENFTTIYYIHCPHSSEGYKEKSRHLCILVELNMRRMLPKNLTHMRLKPLLKTVISGLTYFQIFSR